jgi:multiple sugar transport system permease protein
MAFPAYTTLIPLYRIMSTFGLVNTYTGIVLVYVSGFLPLATWVLHNYFASLPTSIEGGSGRRRQPDAGALASLAAAGPAGDHLHAHHVPLRVGAVPLPLVLSSDLSTQPLTVVIASLQGRHVAPSTLLNAAGILTIAVPAILALSFNRHRQWPAGRQHEVRHPCQRNETVRGAARE